MNSLISVYKNSSKDNAFRPLENPQKYLNVAGGKIDMHNKKGKMVSTPIVQQTQPIVTIPSNGGGRGNNEDNQTEEN